MSPETPSAPGTASGRKQQPDADGRGVSRGMEAGPPGAATEIARYAGESDDTTIPPKAKGPSFRNVEDVCCGLDFQHEHR